MLIQRKAMLFILFIVFLVPCIVIAGCTERDPGELEGTNGWPQKVSIASAPVGGGFFMGASAVATVINNYMEGVDALVEITGASAHNADLLQAGDVQIGLVATDILWEAYHGTGTFEGKPHDEIRTLIPGWPGVYQFITLAKHGIEEIHDLEGKTFSAGPKGSSIEVFCNYVFEDFDIHPKVTHLPSSDASRSLGDGTIDGFSLSWPAPAVTELEATHEVRIVMLNEEQRNQFVEKHPQYPLLSIPPGHYKCLPDGAENPGLYNLVCVRADMPNDFVYEVVKALYENSDTVGKTMSNMGEGMALENIIYATAPYHPGAIQYFREQGVEVPESLIPEEMN